MIRASVMTAVLAVFVTGCGTSPSTTSMSPETQRKAKELYESMKKDAQNKLDEMDKQMTEWKAKTDKATGDTKVAMDKKYTEMKGRRDKFADQVNEFGKTSGDAWEKLKDGMVKSANELTDAFKNAADEFNK